MKTEIDWANLGFNINATNCIIVSHYKDGEWSKPVISSDLSFTLPSFAGALHYGSSCFEGLKAFRGADGKVRVFRPYENAHRLRTSGDKLGMASPTEDLFVEMCLMCVRENIDFLPPYGFNASMYIRPLLMGSNAQLNVTAADEAIFAVMCVPVGMYMGRKKLSPISAVISRNYDRAAPNGTGAFKLSGNYAAAMQAYNIAHKLGYGELLFLDPSTKTKIDEFGSSNFFGIKGNNYVTPLSNSILPSITNKTLQQVALDLGMNVEKRAIPVGELAEFEEVAACGTAVVITPIGYIDDKITLEATAPTKHYEFGNPELCGKNCEKLYDTIRGIQDGIITDAHDWCMIL